MTTRKTRLFWQIEMTADNMLNQHEFYNEPYSGIDFMIESCNIDLIPLKNVTNKNLLGVYGYNGQKRIIACNTKISRERILFTKAHELGHFVLEHELKNDIVTESTIKTKDPQETEANVFAAALLMPKQLIIELLEDLDYDFDKGIDTLDEYKRKSIINDVCTRFRTSKQSAYFRLKNLSKT